MSSFRRNRFGPSRHQWLATDWVTVKVVTLIISVTKTLTVMTSAHVPGQYWRTSRWGFFAKEPEAGDVTAETKRAGKMVDSGRTRPRLDEKATGAGLGMKGYEYHPRGFRRKSGGG